MAQPLEFSVHACTTVSNAGFQTLCQPFGRADEMRQATLPEPLPGLIDEVPITDEDACPVRNELRKCCFGAGWVYLEVGDARIRHHPQPAPVPIGQPRGLVNIIDEGYARHLSNGRIM